MLNSKWYNFFIFLFSSGGWNRQNHGDMGSEQDRSRWDRLSLQNHKAEAVLRAN